MLEKDIQRACLDFLAAKGIFAWRQNPGVIPDGRGGFRRFNGMPGQSDIIGILPKLNDGRTGVFFACELKRPGGKVSDAQSAFLDRVVDEGGVATVVHSVDELEADLAELL